jgi:two-component system sensor histidine kinase HydH
MSRILGRGRWGLLIVAGIASAILMTTAWVNHHAVDTIIWTSARGQAVMLDRILRGYLAELPEGQETLNTFFDDNQHCGLRYVSLGEDGGGELVSGTPQAGEAVPGPGAGPEDPQQFELIEGRVRVTLPAPVAGGLTASSASSELVMEYEPVYWQKLRSQADLQLIGSGLASLLLFGMAFFLRRMTRRADAAVAAAERNKHLASLGEMTAVLAHEIRNPLTSLKGHAQLLVEEDLEDKARGRANRVVGEATRLEALTHNLLAFVRSGEIERTSEDPADIARAAAAVIEDAAVEIQSDDAPSEWSLDRVKVQQALCNLVRNAVEANAEAGSQEAVVVKVARERDQLLFSVADRGPGLTAEAQRRVFEPFFTTKTQGTGLGLAVARRVVSLHGGRIEAVARPGGGALFQTWIPLAGKAG